MFLPSLILVTVIMFRKFGFDKFIPYDLETFELVALKYAILHVQSLGLPVPPLPTFPPLPISTPMCICIGCGHMSFKDSIFCEYHNNIDTYSVAIKEPTAQIKQFHSNSAGLLRYSITDPPNVIYRMVYPWNYKEDNLLPLSGVANMNDIVIMKKSIKSPYYCCSNGPLYSALHSKDTSYSTNSVIWWTKYDVLSLIKKYNISTCFIPLELINADKTRIIYVSELGMFSCGNIEMYWGLDLYVFANLMFAHIRDKKIAELTVRGESIVRETKIYNELSLKMQLETDRIIRMFETKMASMALEIEVLKSSAAVSRVDVIDAGARGLYEKDVTNEEYNKHKYEEQYFYNESFDAWFTTVQYDESQRHIWNSFTALKKKEFDNRPEQYRVSHDYTCEHCNIWLNETELANLAALRTRNDPILYAINRIYSKLRLPELKYLPEEWFENEMTFKLRTLLEANSTIKQTDDNTKMISWERLTEYTPEEKDEWSRMKLIIAPLNLIPPTLKSASIVCKSWKHEDMDVILSYI